MKRIDLKTGFSCNNNCLFCVQGHKKKFGNKSFDELAELMLESARDGYKEIVFTGGEPTIRTDIIDLVVFAKKAGYQRIQIQTNGRRFAYVDFCKDMIAAGANEFSPALHGHIPALHDYLTGAKGSFAQTVKGIMNLKKMGQYVLMNSVITKPNYRHLPQTAKLFIGLRVDQFQFAFVHALGAAQKNFDSIVPRKKLVEPYLKKALAKGISAGVSVMVEAIPYCFLEGYEKYVAEEIMPYTKIYDLDMVVDDFRKSRVNKGKIRGENCVKCIYFERCEGPWREYPKKFGWGEFEPVF